MQESQQPLPNCSLETIQEQLQVCFQCGTCVTSCGPGLVKPGKNLRLLVQELLAAKNALPAAAGDLLWLCTTCYQCEDRCPEGIPLATLLIRIKNMAADQGLLPEAVRKEINALLATGFTFPPLKGILARRKKLGLPDLPLPDDQEMQALFDRIGARVKSSQPKGGSV